MKCFILIAVLSICVVAFAQVQGPIAPVTTLGQDLKELNRLIVTKPLKHLIKRYLLNDAQFQSVIRAVNSQDAYFVRQRFRSQPEVIALQVWMRSQFMLNDDSFELDDSVEILDLLNDSPYWANSVNGWQGFVMEFMAYYQQDLIRAHINMKLAQNGAFTQFWNRLIAVKPAYDRVMNFPETKRFHNQLQAAGVNVQELDHFIRNQFGWVDAGTVAAPAPAPAPGPVQPVPPPVAPIY